VSLPINVGDFVYIVEYETAFGVDIGGNVIHCLVLGADSQSHAIGTAYNDPADVPINTVGTPYFRSTRTAVALGMTPTRGGLRLSYFVNVELRGTGD
jgi:hypothetical protein